MCRRLASEATRANQDHGRVRGAHRRSDPGRAARPGRLANTLIDRHVRRSGLRAAGAAGPRIGTLAVRPVSTQHGIRTAVSNPISILAEPGSIAYPVTRPSVDQPAAPARSVTKRVWRWDPETSFYGPGLYGGKTACGHVYTKQLVGVARPDPSVWHPRLVPQSRERSRGDDPGHRSRAVCRGPHVGPERGAVSEARPLLHRADRMAVRGRLIRARLSPS